MGTLFDSPRGFSFFCQSKNRKLSLNFGTFQTGRRHFNPEKTNFSLCSTIKSSVCKLTRAVYTCEKYFSLNLERISELSKTIDSLSQFFS